MKTQLKINGELKDVEIENGEITIIEPEKKVTGWERVKEDDRYYLTCTTGDVTRTTEEGSEPDDDIYANANYFADKGLAKNINRMQTLQRQMFRWQAKNDITIERNPLYGAYSINYYRDIGIKAYNYPADERSSFLPLFSSIEKVEECIEAFKDELTWLFTEFRWRMDG